MFFKRIFTPGLAINTYLIGDKKTKKCAVIDPTRHVVPLIVEAQNAGLDITDIMESHVHADFVSGAKELKHQLNEKPRIYCSGMGGEKWIPSYADVIVMEGTEVRLGDLRLQAIHTPGHTPEHVIWVCYDESRSTVDPWFAFTGDSLFVGSVGRPDLLGEGELSVLGPQLYHTLFDVLALLPDFTEIFPAHGEGSLCGKALKSRDTSTLGYERRHNSSFKKEDEGEWLRRLQQNMPFAPPYFQRMKKVNVEGAPLLNTLKLMNWSRDKGPSLEGLFLVDIRLPELFAGSHVEGSINIPYGPSFSLWTGWMIPAKTPIGLVTENFHVYVEAAEQLRLMGFDQEIWVIPLDEEQKNESCTFSTFPMAEVGELSDKLSAGEGIYVLDVRSSDEWAEGHLPQAHHIELSTILGRMDELPKDQMIALLCQSGQRASLAASLLRKNGFLQVCNIHGGMQAWKQAGKEISKE